MLVERYLRAQIKLLPKHLLDTGINPDLLVRLAGMEQLIYTSTCFFQTGPAVMSQFFAIQDQTMSTKEQVLHIAASLASRTPSPSFQAIVQAAAEANLPLREIEVDYVGMSGTVAKLDRTWYMLGDDQLMAKEGIELGVSSQAIMHQLEVTGKRLGFLAQKQPKRLLAIFACDKEVDPVVVAAVKKIESLGLEQIILTGEKTRLAKGIATRLHIQLLHTELQSSRKKDIIQSLAAKNPRAAVLYSPATLILKAEHGLPILLSRQAGPGQTLHIQTLTQLADLMEAAQAIVARTRQRFFWCKI